MLPTCKTRCMALKHAALLHNTALINNITHIALLHDMALLHKITHAYTTAQYCNSQYCFTTLQNAALLHIIATHGISAQHITCTCMVLNMQHYCTTLPCVELLKNVTTRCITTTLQHDAHLLDIKTHRITAW